MSHRSGGSTFSEFQHLAGWPLQDRSRDRRLPVDPGGVLVLIAGILGTIGVGLRVIDWANGPVTAVVVDGQTEALVRSLAVLGGLLFGVTRAERRIHRRLDRSDAEQRMIRSRLSMLVSPGPIYMSANARSEPRRRRRAPRGKASAPGQHRPPDIASEFRGYLEGRYEREHRLEEEPSGGIPPVA